MLPAFASTMKTVRCRPVAVPALAGHGRVLAGHGRVLALRAGRRTRSWPAPATARTHPHPRPRPHSRFALAGELERQLHRADAVLCEQKKAVKLLSLSQDKHLYQLLTSGSPATA